MVVVGIVGAIGAGKTTVLRLLAELGARTVAADDLNRQILAPGQPALGQIRAQFGEEYFDEQGALLRRRLGALIFSDEAARRKLDALVHPLMLAELRKILEGWQAEDVEVGVVEAAVLREMGALGLVDKVILVTAPEPQRLQRLQANLGLSAEEAAQRLAAHGRLALDQAQADFVVNNEGTLEQMRKQVEQVWAKLVEAN